MSPELRLYNTLTRRVEPFRPLEAGRVRMYHCGPTVYQRPHIGNHRAFLFADLLRRVFELFGYEVQQVMNLTDVGHLLEDAEEGEDKLEAEARRRRLDPWQIVETVSRQFFEDLDALGVRRADVYPRATEHIPEMVEMIRGLLEKGHAYRVGDNVYFEVATFPEYGKLSGNRVEDLVAGARLDPNPEKKHPADFALWKSDPAHIMKWETEFGPHGFPGWHIECSAMSRRYLGDSFDIHTGGEDNVFPHHECEIAQSEAFSGRPFVSYWMHTRFLQVDGGKMSKSLGNVYTLDDLRERGFDPLDFRFFVLRAHYRGSLNFTWEALKGAREARRSLVDFRGRLEAALRDAGSQEGPAGPEDRVERARRAFREHLADDLATSPALAEVFELRQDFLHGALPPSRLRAARDFLEEVDSVFVLEAPDAAETGLDDATIEALVEQRRRAREARDWATSDRIRDELAAQGVILEDGPSGTTWHRSR